MTQNVTLRYWYPPINVLIDRTVKVSLWDFTSKVTVVSKTINVKTQLTQAHTHDDRYYKKDEIDDKFEEFTPDLTPIQNALDDHLQDTNNPHEVSKEQVGLGSVDNTSDVNKPISNAVQTALNDLSSSITALIGWAPIDANTLKKLNDKILGIQTILTSDDVSLDELQEIINYIKENRTDIDSLGISSIIGLQTALENKVSTSRTITINGVSKDLTTDPSFTIPTATPGGNSTNIQTNKNGALYGEDNFSYDDSTKTGHLFGSLGSEKVSNGTFTGNASGWTTTTWWAYSSNKISHSSNGTGTLSQANIVSFWDYVCLVFTISNLTVGTVSVSLGGVSVGTFSANGIYTRKVRAVSSGALIFTPSNTARFDLDNISVKQFQGGEFSTGKGYFNDKLTVRVNGGNYSPDTVDAFEILNTWWWYSHQVHRFGSTIKSAISSFSDGSMRFWFTNTSWLTLSYGSAISWLSDFGNIGYYGLRMSATNAYIQASWKVSAGNAYSGLPSKLDVWGSEMKMGRRVETQNFTLDDECLYFLDTTNAVGCTGTPSTWCSSYGTNQSLCESHAELGCYFSIQYYCSDFNWDPYTCWNMWCSVVTASCDNTGDSQSCTDQNYYGGNCSFNYYDQDCSPFGETDCNNNSGNGCSVQTSNCSKNYFDCSPYWSKVDCEAQSWNGCSVQTFEYCTSYWETDCGNDSNCTKAYYDCAQYNGNDTACNEQSWNGCSYDYENNTCNGWNFTNCLGNFQSCYGWNYTGCGGGGNCSSLSEGDCESGSYFTGCTGYISYYICEGTKNTWACGGWAYGLCGWTATCGNVVQGRCNNTYNPGCLWTNTLNIYVPNSNTFYTTYQGNLDRAMTRDYTKTLIWSGTVTLRTLWNDTFEDGSTIKTLSAGGKYRSFFFAVKGNCTDFNGNENWCISQSWCSPTYDYPEWSDPVYLSCSWEYQKYKKWFVATL